MQSVIIIIMALMIFTATTSAGVYHYEPNRVLILDAQLASSSQADGPEAAALPQSEQSVSILDTKDHLRGHLTIITEAGSEIMDSMSFSIEACLDLAPDSSGSFLGVRECYVLTDTIDAIDYSADGRIYKVVNGFQPPYDIHFIRRESDPMAHDPSAIFQLHLQQPGRVVTLLLFFKLSGSQP